MLNFLSITRTKLFYIVSYKNANNELEKPITFLVDAYQNKVIKKLNFS